MQRCFILISLATIGVCVFGASASVDALFYFVERRNGYEKGDIPCAGANPVFLPVFLWK